MDSPARDVQYWDLLTSEDKEVYRRINAALAAPTSRNKRNKRVDDFREILEAIELFQDSGAEDRWKRCLVCGVCMIPKGIAVNTTQLKRLVFKCKSSINGSLKRLGWGTILSKPSAYEDLLNQIPYLREHPAEVRQWTIRVGSGGDEEQETDISPPCAEEATAGEFSVGTIPWPQDGMSGSEMFEDFQELGVDF
jgi:hypothetical protein